MEAPGSRCLYPRLGYIITYQRHGGILYMGAHTHPIIFSRCNLATNFPYALHHRPGHHHPQTTPPPGTQDKPKNPQCPFGARFPRTRNRAIGLLVFFLSSVLFSPPVLHESRAPAGVTWRVRGGNFSCVSACTAVLLLVQSNGERGLLVAVFCPGHDGANLRTLRQSDEMFFLGCLSCRGGFCGK